jgi:hypothetical protein
MNIFLDFFLTANVMSLQVTIAFLRFWPQPCVSSLQLDVGCPVVIAAAIPDAMLLPTDKYFAQEVPEPEYDGLTCPKYALWDSNPGLWLDNLIVLFEL